MARAPVTEERRAQILDGLFDAMARGGSDQASVTEIAHRAGLPRGALHYYFRPKDEMRRALMERLGERYLHGLRGALTDDDGRPHTRALRRLVRFHLGGDVAQTERLLSVWIDFWGQAPGDRELARIIQHVQQRVREVFAQGLVASGCPARGADLEARAAVCLAVVEGVMLQWRMARLAGRPLDVERLQAAAVQQLERAAVEVV